MKKIQELRNMSNNQFKNRLNEIESSLRRGRGYNSAGKPYFILRKLRKEKAQILTLLRERELNIQRGN